jgi:hypothetical protein
MPTEAVQHVRRMRGGAQAQLMRARDGHFYIVKFQNNPQHLRVLANELLASRLGERVGLPVPVAEVVEVGEWLIENTPELRIDLGMQPVACAAGLQFGSRCVIDPGEGAIFDYLPDSLMARVKNLSTFAGMLVVDKWLGNANGRQAVFWRKGQERKYNVSFIDHGYCFDAGAWDFPDSALRGVYARNCVYEHVTGWHSFEPWLSRVENFDPEAIREAAEDIPPEWTGHDWQALKKLVEAIIERRPKVRALIAAFRDSSRQPFPAWSETRERTEEKSGVES